MKHPAKIVQREVQHHENLVTGERAWFGQIRVEIPYEWEIAWAKRELARGRATMTEAQIERELARIDRMVWLKYSPHRFLATAGPYQDRDGAFAAVTHMVDASATMDPYRFKDFCDKLWYPEHGNCRPDRLEDQTNSGDPGQQPVWMCRVKIVEPEVQHREDLGAGIDAWVGVITVESPTAWAVDREKRRLDAKRAKLTDQQIARAEKRIDRLKDPFEYPSFLHQAGPYRERQQAVAAIEQMVDAAGTMTPDQHARFCRTFWRPDGGFRPL